MLVVAACGAVLIALGIACQASFRRYLSGPDPQRVSGLFYSTRLTKNDPDLCLDFHLWLYD
jgi:hypothetical protein